MSQRARHDLSLHRPIAMARVECAAYSVAISLPRNPAAADGGYSLGDANQEHPRV
jgi:hypothetical protein